MKRGAVLRGLRAWFHGKKQKLHVHPVAADWDVDVDVEDVMDVCAVTEEAFDAAEAELRMNTELLDDGDLTIAIPAVTMTEDELLAAIDAATASLGEALEISREQARGLLSKHTAHWDLQRLQDAIGADFSSIDELRAVLCAAPCEPDESSGELFECCICACEVPRGDVLSCLAGHLACVDCWRRHLDTSVVSGGLHRLCCLFPSCSSTPLDRPTGTHTTACAHR